MPILPANCDIAAANAPALCVVAGPEPAIRQFIDRLNEQGTVNKLLMTSHAFHSSMMDAAVEPFAEFVASVPRYAPQIPIRSTVTSDWLTDEQAQSSRYWAEHMRKPVLFSETVDALLAEEGAQLFLEIGPRSTLTTLARKNLGKENKTSTLVSSLGDQATDGQELRSFLHAVGSLWCAGYPLAWNSLSVTDDRQRPRYRGALPEYAFERKRLFIEPATARNAETAAIPTESTSSLLSSPVMAAVVPQNTRSASSMQALTLAVREVFENSSGVEIQDADLATNYLEMGLDSLMLTQVAAALQRKFQVEITFRQLLEDQASVQQLVAWLDQKLPADQFADAATTTSQVAVAVTNPVVQPAVASSTVSTPEVAQVPCPAPLPTNVVDQPVVASTMLPAPVAVQMAQPITMVAANGGNALQTIIQQQLMLMQNQLQLLSGVQPTIPAVSVTAPISAPSAVTPTASVSTASPVEAVKTKPAVPAPSQTVTTTETQEVPEPKKVFGAQARVSLQSVTVDADFDRKLRKFIEQYNEYTARSKAYAQKHRRHLADPRTVTGFQPLTKELTYPIVVERSKAAYVHDIDGHRYIDLTCGYGSNFFGHSPDFMVQALSKQLETGYEIGPQSVLTGEVAELFCELTGNERVAFCNTGSEAVLGAMRLARTISGRDKFVMFTAIITALTMK